MMRVFVGSTLVGGDEGDILGSGRHTEYLVAIDLPLYLRQVSKGAGDARRKIWNMTHLHQQLYREWKHMTAVLIWCDKALLHSLGPNIYKMVQQVAVWCASNVNEETEKKRKLRSHIPIMALMLASLIKTRYEMQGENV